MTQSGENQFRDPTRLTKWTKWFLYAQVVISFIAMISGGLQYQLLSNIERGVFHSTSQAVAAAQANDQRQAVVGTIQFGIFLLFSIAYYMWLYRANFNARQLGASGMKYTPGWSVGWYFVPFANFWMPYKVMKELWRTSASPQNWQEQPVSSLIKWWWFIWVVSHMMDMQAFKLTSKADDFDMFMIANVVTVISDLLDMIMSLVMITLVRKVYELQMSHYRENLVDQPAIVADQV